MSAVLCGLLAVLGASSAVHAAPAAPEVAGTGVVRVVEESADAPEAEAAARVAHMTVREQAASVVMGHIPTQDLTALRQYMQAGLGGFILMGANVPSDEAALRAVTGALVVDESLPPLIAVDQEGGEVSRLAWDSYAAADTLKGAEPDAVNRAYAQRGAVVARAGITVNFGTVGDVPLTPDSFIYERSFGMDFAAASRAVSEATAGQEAFVASTVKHFPGHGAAEGDSHQLIPTSTMSYEEWLAQEALPFRAAIDADVSLVMVGHLLFSSIDDRPASLSPRWHAILRDELGFDGVIVTDDLGMLQASGDPLLSDPVRNAVTSLSAGSDLLLTVIGTDSASSSAIIDGIVHAVANGDVPEERLIDAATRVMTLRLQVNADTVSGWSVCASCAPAP